MSLVNDHEEDLDDFPAENRAKTWRVIGRSMSRRVDRSKNSRKWNHNKSCKYEELIDDWVDLTVLEAENRGPALKNRLVGDGRNAHGTSGP